MCEWAGVLGVPRVRPSMPLDRSRYVIGTILYDLSEPQNGNRGPLVDFFNVDTRARTTAKPRSSPGTTRQGNERKAPLSPCS